MKIINCQTLGEMCEFMLDGEPVFMIRAQDMLSVEIVSEYADRAFSAKAKNLGRVSSVLSAMRDWQAQNPKKVKIPD